MLIDGPLWLVGRPVIRRVLLSRPVRIFGSTFGLSPIAANAAATTVVGSIPGLFGFLAWELMGNWRLFAANRPRNLLPVAIGSHGETMIRLMRPGFHSGTLPKLYAKMRRAESKAAKAAHAASAGEAPSGSDRKHRKLHRDAHHVEQALRHFAERELIRLLTLSPGWGGHQIAVAGVRLGSNRIVFELGCSSLGAEPMLLAFEEQSGWLLACTMNSGWSATLGGGREKS